MQPTVALRRMKCVPRERDFLDKDSKDVSQRTVDILRALSSERTRCGPLAPPGQVDTSAHAHPSAKSPQKVWEDTHSKVAHAMADLFGTSGRRMRKAGCAGERTPYQLAALAMGP
jgi:hypothetical protein